MKQRASFTTPSAVVVQLRFYHPVRKDYKTKDGSLLGGLILHPEKGKRTFFHSSDAMLRVLSGILDRAKKYPKADRQNPKKTKQE